MGFFLAKCHTMQLPPATICEFGIEFLPTRLWDNKIFSSQFCVCRYFTAVYKQKPGAKQRKKANILSHTTFNKKILQQVKKN